MQDAALESDVGAGRDGRARAVETREDFRPAWWLPNRHLQTLWGQFTRERSRVAFRREWLETPDGDAVALDHVDPASLAATSQGPAPGAAPATAAERPRLLVLHGLEGSSFSVYVQGLLALAAARGWEGVALNFRSCAREPGAIDRWLPGRRPRLYHSGETSDLDHVARTLRARAPEAPLLAVGISLGGNVLLKWLGENPGQRVVDAAATVSVPYDLAAGARHLESRLGRMYLRHFLPTLVAKVEDLARRFPDLRDRGLDLAAARAARDFQPFDDAATAPIHGFAGADDYYARSSSIAWVARVDTPTLCLSAEDDPFLPRAALHRFREVASPAIDLCVTERGGHVGFVAGRHPRGVDYWAERQAVDWLAAHLRTRA
jgi:predicted alpha/beta-fold hydrolase